MTYKQNRSHRPWKIVAGCCCIQGSVLGLLVNCRGLFFEPVCADLGFNIGGFTAYGLFYGLACVIAIPTAAKVLERYDLRVTLTLSSVFMALVQALFGSFTRQWHWYAAAALQGMASAFLFSLTTPLLINNWFTQKRGMMLAITGMSSGAVAAIMNPIGSMVIEQLGWRAGYRFFGLLFLLMTLPATIFWLRLRPKTAEPPSGGSSLSGFQGNVWRTIRQPGFLLLIVITGIANLLTCYSQMLSSYGAAIGLTASACAMLLSLSMVGNVLLKLLLGAIHDLANALTAVMVGIGLLSLGFLLMLTNGRGIMLSIASFLMGTPMAITTVIVPLLVSEFFGSDGYSQKYAYVTMSANLCSSLGISVFGAIVSLGGYPLSQLTGLILAICVGVLTFGIHLHVRKHTQKNRVVKGSIYYD